eukprot:gene2394-3236_t
MRLAILNGKYSLPAGAGAGAGDAVDGAAAAVSSVRSAQRTADRKGEQVKGRTSRGRGVALGPAAAALLSAMLRVDHRDRPTAGDVAASCDNLLRGDSIVAGRPITRTYFKKAPPRCQGQVGGRWLSGSGLDLSRQGCGQEHVMRTSELMHSCDRCRRVVSLVAVHLASGVQDRFREASSQVDLLRFAAFAFNGTQGDKKRFRVITSYIIGDTASSAVTSVAVLVRRDVHERARLPGATLTAPLMPESDAAAHPQQVRAARQGPWSWTWSWSWLWPPSY